MKKFFAVFYALGISAYILGIVNLNNAIAQNIAIIPQPVSVSDNGAMPFKLGNPTIISADTKAGKEAAEFLAKRIVTATGYDYQIADKGGDIMFNINPRRNEQLGNEGYTLRVTAEGVTISANTSAGLFYGVQSLIQLFPKEIESGVEMKDITWELPPVTISDYPRFAWRGLMLDVSRHFFSVNDVKRYIDNMARYKYNVFHWHLTDDHGWRIEIKSLPQLTQKGACRVKREGKFGNYEWPKDGEPATDCGYYTQEQVKDIIAYAAKRHIQVLPEIDVPGHSSAAIAAFPDLSCTKDPKAFVNPGCKISEWYGDGKFKLLVDNSLNPSDERVYGFLDTVFTEIASLFPYPYIHIGGDECYHGYWEKDSGCVQLMRRESLKNTQELQSYFVKRVEKIITSKGKKLIGWDEILQGGIAPQATVMSWRGMQGGIEAASQGHYVVMTPNQNVYIDLPQGDIAVEPDALTYGTVRLKSAYEFEPVPANIDSKYILGGQANLWTEKVYDMKHGEYMTFPRAWALADVYWSPRTSRNWDKFITRMEAHMQRANIAGINYARSAYDPIIKPTIKNGKLYVDVSTEINGLDIYYTLQKDGSAMKKFVAPIEIPKTEAFFATTTIQNGKPVGKMIVLSREELMKRAKG